jgi:hypothetical protein
MMVQENNGRWRLRLDTPYAEIQDVTPLARLVQTVNNQFPADYERAKSAFIGALQTASVRLNDLNDRLEILLAPLTAKKPAVTIGDHNMETSIFTFQHCKLAEGSGKEVSRRLEEVMVLVAATLTCGTELGVGCSQPRLVYRKRERAH